MWTFWCCDTMWYLQWPKNWLRCKQQVSGSWGNRRKRARNRQSGGYTICLAASRISVAQYLFTWFSALLTTFSTLLFLRSYSLNCSAGCLHWNVGEREDRKWNEGHVDSMWTILSFAWIYFQGLKAIVLMAAFLPEYIFFYLTLKLQICNNTKSHFENIQELLLLWIICTCLHLGWNLCILIILSLNHVIFYCTLIVYD